MLVRVPFFFSFLRNFSFFRVSILGFSVDVVVVVVDVVDVRRSADLATAMATKDEKKPKGNNNNNSKKKSQ